MTSERSLLYTAKRAVLIEARACSVADSDWGSRKAACASLYCERDNKDELKLAPTTTTTCARADSTHPALLLWRAARMISECSY